MAGSSRAKSTRGKEGPTRPKAAAVKAGPGAAAKAGPGAAAKAGPGAAVKAGPGAAVKAGPAKGPAKAPAKAAPEKPPRKRRDAAEARAAILDAAERRLVEAGPSGIRLQEVAADVGVSHPTVLHHFGSREALVGAVIARSFAAIHADLVAAIERSSGGEEQLRCMLDAVFHSLSAGGHGRVLMWMALSGHTFGGAEVPLTAVVDASHALRMKKRCGEEQPPSREDTAHTVVLAAMALIASAVLGGNLLENAGLAGGEGAQARFRAWLARVLVAHLESGKG